MLIYLFALFSSHTRQKLILISSPRSSCWCCAEIYRAEKYKMIFGNSLGSLSHFCSHVRKNSPIHLLSASPNLPIHVIRESVGIACSVLVGVLPKKTTLKEEEKLQWENREEQQQQLTKTSTPGHRQCRLLWYRSEVREEEKTHNTRNPHWIFGYAHEAHEGNITHNIKTRARKWERERGPLRIPLRLGLV